MKTRILRRQHLYKIMLPPVKSCYPSWSCQEDSLAKPFKGGSGGRMPHPVYFKGGLGLARKFDPPPSPSRKTLLCLGGGLQGAHPASHAFLTPWGVGGFFTVSAFILKFRAEIQSKTPYLRCLHDFWTWSHQIWTTIDRFRAILTSFHEFHQISSPYFQYKFQYSLNK